MERTCPLQRKTSPTSTSVSVTGAAPEELAMAMVVGVALAAAAGSTTSTRPLASHVAGGSAAPPYVTVTAAPGASRPQSATGLPP